MHRVVEALGAAFDDDETTNLDRWQRALVLVPVVISIALTAVTLWPEVSLPIPSLNDDAFQFLLVQGASNALSTGQNPLDFWSPNLEVGFPQFLYYQHLPHLAVALLDHALFQRVDLLLLFNLTRYALLVSFPVTVLWSVRRMGFSLPAAAAAATFAPLLAENLRFGFAYDSYIWRGFGMYTQLWAMHLSFISLALLHRTMHRGEGYAASIAALAALVLSHLVYAYMMAITVGVMLLVGLNRGNARDRFVRLGAVGVAAGVVTSYFWLPFLLSKEFLNASIYLQEWKYDSYGAGVILPWLVSGDLWDHARLPVFTAVVALGVVVALVRRSRPAVFALVLSTVWLLLYFGRPTWGGLLNVLPMHDGLLIHRFLGSVDLAAMLLVAVAGGATWSLLRMHVRWPAPMFGIALIVVALPAFAERATFNTLNTDLMAHTAAVLDADTGARDVLSTLRQLPPGRTFAGLRTDWGARLQLGDLNFRDLLTFNGIEGISVPYQSVSLNADLTWFFDYTNPAHYRLFNVRYVVAPTDVRMPPFLSVVSKVAQYTLYQGPDAGYFELGGADVQFVGTQHDYQDASHAWFDSPLPAAGVFPAVDVGGGRSPLLAKVLPLSEGRAVLGTLSADPGAPRGRVVSAVDLADTHTANIEVTRPSTLVLKVTYHPNWDATIDGKPVPTFMVMPSYIGVNVAPGPHQVQLHYRARTSRTALFLLGAVTLVASFVAERRRAEVARMLDAAAGTIGLTRGARR